MTDIRDILESAVDSLLGRSVTPALLHETEAGVWPAGLWSEVEAAGLTLAAVSEEAGGAGASWSEVFGLVRAIGRHSAPIPLAEALIANWLLAKCGLAPVSGAVTIACASENGFTRGRFTGALTGVPWGGASAHVVVVSGPDLLLMKVSDARIEAGANIAREPRDRLVFEAATPVAAARSSLGAEALFRAGALVRSAQIAGGMERVLGQAAQYANERAQFGRLLAQFQAIQQMLAQAGSQVLMAHAAAEAAFEAADDGCSEYTTAAAKVCTSELAGALCATAHAVHGAIGISHEHSLHITTRRLWSWRSEFGSQSFWAERLGRAACEGGAPALWPAIVASEFRPGR